MLVVFFVMGSVAAQNKYEKEVRVSESEVPPNARNFVEKLNLRSKIKWYQEFGTDKISFEAKTKKEETRYSVEFSGDGLFEDMEIGVAPHDVPQEVMKKMRDYLNDTFRKYAIDKIQVQYSGSEEAVLAFLKKESAISGLVVHYEVVVSAKEDGNFSLFEFLFDAGGGFNQRYKIVLQNTENLEY